MEFRPTAELDADVLVEHDDDLAIAIPAESVDLLRGATLAFNGGMVMQNPNRPLPPVARVADRPEADLSGEIPQRVIEVLEEQINPAIASHGGYAELVAVEDSIAYLRMGGGCQGCGMAAVTLTQGIEVAILDTVPGDHRGGRRDRPRVGRQPVLRGRQEVDAPARLRSASRPRRRTSRRWCRRPRAAAPT